MQSKFAPCRTYTGGVYIAKVVAAVSLTKITNRIQYIGLNVTPQPHTSTD